MTPPIGSPANAPQVSSPPPCDPQEAPSIFVDPRGNRLGGIFIEEVDRPSDGALEITGWKFGAAEFQLASVNGILPLEITDSDRLDVQEVFSLESGKCGFIARADRADPGSEYQLLWRFDPTQEFLKASIRIPTNSSEKNDDPTASTDLAVKPEDVPNREGGIHIDFVAGSELVGWSLFNGSPAPLGVVIGGTRLGRIPTTGVREDVRQHFGIGDPLVGFRARIGGLTQFTFLTEGCDAFSLEQESDLSLSRSVNLADFKDQLDLFSPLMGLKQDERMGPLGWVRDIRATKRDRCLFLFQTSSEFQTENDLSIAFFQENVTGQVQRVDRSTLSCNGELVQVEARLLTIDQPLLIVVTNDNDEIQLTDMIPLPALFLPENAMLIEIYSALDGGQRRYETAALLNQNYLLQRLRISAETTGEETAFPTRRNTAVILFDRRANDPLPEVDFEEATKLFDSALRLGKEKGVLIQEDESSIDFETLLEDPNLTHFVLLDRTATLRPDFWEILARYSQNLAKEDTALAYGDSIVVNGLERPYLVKHSILNHPTFRRHQLVDLKTAIVRKALLKETVAVHSDEFAGGIFRLEYFFAEIQDDQLLHIPVVLDQSIHENATKTTRKFFLDRQVSLPFSPQPVTPCTQEAGISVIIEFCNSPNQTLLCLDSLALQEFSGDLEVVLIDNRSTATYSDQVAAHAKHLFGIDRVQVIGVGDAGNERHPLHLGAMAASHEFLFFLSNHCLLVDRNLLAEAREIAAVPWVGTCGFRIIGGGNGGLKLLSLGLRGSPRSLMIPGAPAFTGNPEPSFLENCTIEVVGNSLLATCLRKEVFDSLGGFENRTLLTEKLEVEFCFRAARRGFRHVAIGSSIVECRNLEASRFDTDICPDPGIFDAGHSIDELSRFSTDQL